MAIDKTPTVEDLNKGKDETLAKDSEQLAQVDKPEQKKVVATQGMRTHEGPTGVDGLPEIEATAEQQKEMDILALDQRLYFQGVAITAPRFSEGYGGYHYAHRVVGEHGVYFLGDREDIDADDGGWVSIWVEATPEQGKIWLSTVKKAWEDWNEATPEQRSEAISEAETKVNILISNISHNSDCEKVSDFQKEYDKMLAKDIETKEGQEKAEAETRGEEIEEDFLSRTQK